MGIYRGYLHSIAVDWTNTNTSAPKNIAIYLGTTTQTGFATTTSWVSTNSLQQVYSDSNNVHTIGWNIYQLDSNFYWDGTSNLVFAFLSNHNGSSTTTNTAGSYASQYTSEYRTIYKYADNTIMVPATITAAAASSRTYYRTDIRIEACVDIPTCPKPRDVVASNIDSTSATLSWMEVGSASSWNIVLSTTPLTDPQTAANPLAASTNPFAITGLTPNTVYYVYIQADCSSETSRWTSACMFRTQCGATVLPLVENFDTYGASARPSCWHAIVPSGTLQTSTGYAASGNYSMYSYTSQGSYNVLISPELNEDIHTLMVNFKVSGDGDLAPEYPSTVVVGVMNNYNSIATFYPIDTVAPTVAEQFAEFDVSFAGYPADSLNGRYIAFKFAPIGNLAESCWTYLDDVTISLIPVCNRPNSLTVIGVDTSSVTLSWSDSTGSAWQVVYGPRGCNPDSMLLIPSNVISNIANDSITINNLTFGTSYDFYVRTECATDYSTWRGDASATVGNQYIMATTGIDTITGCGFVIYDNGGSNGNYASSCNSTLVIDPGVGNLATIRGRMATESCCDHLSIYDCIGTSGLLLYTFQGEDDSIGTFTSEDGPITVVFTSDGSVEQSGFELITGCVPAPTCPRPMNLTATNATTSAVTFGWTERGSATNWIIEYGPRNFTLGTGTQVLATSNPFTVTGLPASYIGEFYVRAVCSATDSSIYSRNSCPFILNQIPATIPYSYNFETPAEWANWQTNSNNTVHWQRGTAGSSSLGTGSNGMFVTGNDTSAAAVISINNVAAYRDINFGTIDSSFTLGFDANMGGRTDGRYDGLMVFLVSPDSTVEASSTSITSPWGNVNSLYRVVNIRYTDLQNGWTHFDASFDTISGVHRVAFFWFNQTGTTFVGEMAKVYNITIDYSACPRPVALQATTTGVSAALSWEGPSSASYEIIYRAANTTTNMFAYSNTNSYTITGLTPLTNYYCWVRKICGNDTSLTCDGIEFITDICSGAIYDTIGTGTTTEYNYPVNNFYKYTYTQTIIDSAELNGPMDISAIAYQYASTTAMTSKTNCVIYMGYTTKSVFTSNTDFIPVDSLHIVYTGVLNCTQGWNMFALDTVFSYDGTRNIVIAVDDNSNAYNSSACTFYSTNCTGNKTIHAYSDSNNPIPANMASFSGSKSVVTRRANMQLIACGAEACPTPVVTSETHTYGQSTIAWTGEGNNYEVAIKAASAATWPTETAVAAHTYTFSGLTPATSYQYRVRQDCDTNGTSEWAEGTFTTDSLPCFAPTALTATAQGTTADIDWTPGTTETAWIVNVYNSTFNQSYAVTAHPYTVTGLTPDVTYNVKVSAICGNATDTSDWSTPISFATESCDPVTNVAVSSLTSTSATITWTAGENNTGSWQLEYGYAGFGQGEGTTINATTNSATISGLTAGVAYDVYVRAICGEGYNSNWSTKVTFTPVGIENVTGGTQLNLYPNPTTGMTTISLSGVQGSVTLTIVDMSGRTVKTETMECSGDCAKKLDVDNLSQGAYFVRVNGENVNVVKKLIVK